MICIHNETLLRCLTKTAQAVRLTLFPGETLRLPRTCGAVSVWLGRAWISYGGQDVQLMPGEIMTLSRNDAAVVSALGGLALVLELKEN